MKLVSWRVSNRTWAKWHYMVDPGVTVCGKAIPPQQPWGGPIIHESGSQPEKTGSLCGTCVWRSRPHLRKA